MAGGSAVRCLVSVQQLPAVHSRAPRPGDSGHLCLPPQAFHRLEGMKVGLDHLSPWPTHVPLVSLCPHGQHLIPVISTCPVFSTCPCGQLLPPWSVVSTHSHGQLLSSWSVSIIVVSLSPVVSSCPHGQCLCGQHHPCGQLLPHMPFLWG